MKRRDFIASSAGVAGAVLSSKALAQALPCPPPQVGATGGSSSATDCGVAPPPPGSAPAWFVSMADSTWASPTTNTLTSVAPPSPPGNFESICNAWNGGCVDQVRGELILAANGGHGDYFGNEVYACALRAASPAWVRLNNPSTGGGGSDARNSAGNLADGRMRSVHGYNRCTFGNGRVWYAGMDGMSASGEWSTAVWSFNRASLAWTAHGRALPTLPGGGSDWSMEGGPSAYDRVGNRVWSAPQYSVTNPAHGAFSVDASTGAITNYPGLELPDNPRFGLMWSVIAPDLRVWIIASSSNNAIYVLNLDDPNAGFVMRPTTGSPTAFTEGFGAVYHQPSRAVLLWRNNGRNVIRLGIPANPRTGTYTWSQLPLGSGGVTPSAGQPNGTFSRFNIIDDMGNGRSALVLINSVTTPVYVYKLPAAV